MAKPLALEMGQAQSHDGITLMDAPLHVASVWQHHTSLFDEPKNLPILIPGLAALLTAK